jgi:hypothetical protein
MTLELRKKTELATKCAAFLGDLDRWKIALENFPQHTSQVTRLHRIFQTQASNLQGRLEGVQADGAAEGLAEILLLFRVWAFYRQKLDQRFVPEQDRFLRVADELAFTWWSPARQAAMRTTDTKEKARLAKEPPLIFLNGDVSPFTVTRKIAFEAEVAVGLNESQRKWSARLMKQAPVPVVGVPYFAARHVPDLMVIAHEVGHNVEDDFNLTPALNRALEYAVKKASANSKAAWSAWRDEIFADLWGVLVGGLAFVDALVDFLPSEVQAVRRENPASEGWGKYPTTVLRVELLFAALEALGLRAAAKERRREFRARHKQHALAELEQDIPGVVGALLDCKPPSFVGTSVKDAAGFDAAEELGWTAEIAQVAGGQSPDLNSTTAKLTKVIASAFRIAPERISEPDRSKALWSLLNASVVNGVRSSRVELDANELAAADAELTYSPLE